MGCAEDRGKCAHEERELEVPLRELGFQFLFCREVDETIRKYSSGDFISTGQMMQITSTLKLPALESSDVSMQFYSSLSEGAQYRRQLFILACLHLTKGDWADKATLIFEAFDEDMSHLLNKEEFLNMWQVLQTLVLDLLPAVVNLSEQLTEYLHRLRVSAADARLEAEAELFRSNALISLPAFRNCLRIGPLKALLHPRLLRCYIGRFYRGQRLVEKQPFALTHKKKKKKRPEADIDQMFGFTKT